MCANGPASRSGSASDKRGLVDQGVLEVLAAQHRHQAHAVLVVGDLDQGVDDPVHLLALGGGGRLLPALAPGRLRVAQPLPGRVEQRQVGHRPGLAVGALQLPHVLAAEPGGAFAQVGGDRPQVGDEIGRLDQRPRPVEGRAQLPVLLQRPAQLVGADTMLARIVTMVSDAQRSRAPIQAMADKVSGYFVPAVLGMAVKAHP